MARVMVLMCGLVLTWVADVECCWMAASTWAAVYVVAAGAAAEPAVAVWGVAAACVGVTAWALVMATVVVSATAAAPATAKRVRIDDMGVGASIYRQLTLLTRIEAPVNRSRNRLHKIVFSEFSRSMGG